MRGVNTLFEVEPIRMGFTHNSADLKRETVRRNIANKIENFTRTAINPQTLTIPRDPLSTDDGNRVFRVLKGRLLQGIPENGVRAVVQENSGWGVSAKVRFIMSPLFGNEHDARSWARREYEAE